MKYITLISRILLGGLFIFSGFVKAIDPMGSAYKFIDYFASFNLSFLDNFALLFSILLSSLEFIIGAAILFNQRIKISSLGGLFFMAFFTPLTLYIAIKNPVSDCGCFGDALKISNWETFYKNIFLLAFAIIVFIRKDKIKSNIKPLAQWAIIGVFSIFILCIAIYSLRHLPLIDFSNYKVGSSMKIDDTVQEKYFLTYRNIETGETKEYLSPDFPWDDPEWVAAWEFVSQRVEGASMPENILYVIDQDGNDYTKSITQNHDFHFMLLSNDLRTANFKKIDKINQFAAKSLENSLNFVLITGSSLQSVQDFQAKYNPNFEVFYGDEIALKTFVRANPGLVLMKDGVILAKWHHNDFPVFEKINFKKLESKFLKNF